MEMEKATQKNQMEINDLCNSSKHEKNDLEKNISHLQMELATFKSQVAIQEAVIADLKKEVEQKVRD